jgi:hypothetical protein
MNTKNGYYDCDFCSSVHSSIIDLPVNKKLIELIQNKPREVYRSKSTEKLRALLNRLALKLNEFKKEAGQGEMTIKNHFDLISNQVIQKTEQKKLDLETKYTQLSNEIESKKQILLKKLEHDKNKEELNSINEINAFLNKFDKYLSNYEIEDQEIEAGVEKADEFLHKIDSDKKEFKSKLFNHESIVFQDEEKELQNDISLGTMMVRPLGAHSCNLQASQGQIKDDSLSFFLKLYKFCLLILLLNIISDVFTLIVYFFF